MNIYGISRRPLGTYDRCLDVRVQPGVFLRRSAAQDLCLDLNGGLGVPGYYYSVIPVKIRFRRP